MLQLSKPAKCQLEKYLNLLELYSGTHRSFKRSEQLFVSNHVAPVKIIYKDVLIEIQFKITFNDVGNAYLTKSVKINGVKNNDINYLQHLVN